MSYILRVLNLAKNAISACIPLYFLMISLSTSDTISRRFTSLLLLLKSVPLGIETSHWHLTLDVQELYDYFSRFIPSKCDLPLIRRSFQNFNISFREFSCVEFFRGQSKIYWVCQFEEKLKNPPLFFTTHEMTYIAGYLLHTHLGY